MKSITKILPLFIGLLLIVSCNSLSKEEQEYDVIMQNVINVHDEVMPKMGELSSLIKSLENKKDTTTLGKTYAKAQLDLKSSYDFMMNWMSDFSTKFPYDEKVKKENVAAKIILLKEEEIEVNKLKNQINSSIKNAKELLQQ